jgi:uncharacterized membrane protein
MTIAADLLPAWLSAALWLCLVATCALAARYADWAALRAVPSRYHLFFGGGLCCLLLWLISVNAVDGLWFHFLGITTLTLLLGWRFAMLTGTAAIVIHTLLIGQPLAAASAAWLLTVAVPASISRWLVHRLRRLRSRNLFIYMLGAGFGGGLLSVLASAAAAVPLLWSAGQADMAQAAIDNWPLIFLLLFPEGFINGMVVTTLTVFYPGLVKTFDDDYYLDDGREK